MNPPTQLCNKKFKLMFAPGRRECFEREFYKIYLLQGFIFSLPSIPTLYLQDVSILAERCKRLEIQIIGIETSLESSYPLTVKVFEDFTGHAYNHEWINWCIEELRKENIIKDLLIYINITDDVFDKLKVLSIL